MAFPFVFHSNFEQGTNGEWDSETDTVAQMDFPHVKDLASTPWPTAVPYSGAYCARVQLTGGTADAILTEGDLNISADADVFNSFKIWFSPDFSATANDTVHILELKATSTVELCVGFRIVAATGAINMGIGEVAPTSFAGLAMERGVWYTIESGITLDDGGSDDGTIDIYITKEGDQASAGVAATQVGTLDQGAVTTGDFGITNHLATTTGTILLDEFVFDDARIYAEEDRPVSKWDVLLTKSSHLFVGRGQIDDAILMPGAGTDCVLTIYDTNAANTNDATNIVGEVKNVTNSETVNLNNVPVCVERGAYITLSGTNPRARLVFSKTNAHGSVANVKQYGKSGAKR